MLPLVGAIVSDVVELYADVHERRGRLALIRQQRQRSEDDNPYEAELRQSEADLDADVAKLDEYVDELLVLGLELRDPVTGVVGFPSLTDGEEVRLCWRLGEDEVGHWQSLDAGIHDRRTLDDGYELGDDEDEGVDA